MIWLYRFLMYLVEVFSKLLFPLLNRKLQFFFANQGKVNKKLISSDSPIWIHASSGEIEYAIPLIEELSRQAPHIPLLVTHSSLSSKKNIDQLNVAMTGVIPFDSYKSVYQFLSQVNPRALLISRTEIWPELIHQLRLRDIPSFLFSATFAPGSKKMGLLSRFFLSQTLSQLTQIFVVSNEDRTSAQKLFPNAKFISLGDTRYDRVSARLANSTDLNLPYHSKIFILGSTWEEDEKMIFPILNDLKKSGWKIIWTPHEINPQHIIKLKTQIQNLNLSSQLWSQNPSRDLWDQYDILIIDKMGLLAGLYKLGRVSFVGGSFKKQVHSVMEPLGAYTPVVVGPFYQNNREAIEFLNLGCVKTAKTSHEILESLTSFDSDYEKVTQLLKKEIENRKGATLKLMKALKDLGLF